MIAWYRLFTDVCDERNSCGGSPLSGIGCAPTLVGVRRFEGDGGDGRGYFARVG